MPHLHEPVVGCVRSRVAGGLARFAFTFAIAWVIEDQDGDVQLPLQVVDGSGPVTQVAGIAVAVEHGALVRLPAGSWTPPAVKARAVGETQFNVLHERIGRSNP